MLTDQATRDHVEIGQLIARYGKALDDKNFGLLDRVFTPDARLHYEMEDRETRASYAEWSPIFREFLASFYWTGHLFGQPVIELEGDAARSSCPLIASHVQIEHDGKRNLWVVHGFYRDHLLRTEAGWRIRERRFQGVHTEGQLLAPDRVKPFPEANWG